MPKSRHSTLYYFFIVASLCFGLCIGYGYAGSPGPESANHIKTSDLKPADRLPPSKGSLTDFGGLYPLTSLTFVYARPHPDHPAPRRLKETTISLVKSGRAYFSPAEITEPTQQNKQYQVFEKPLSYIEGKTPSYLSAGVLTDIITASVKTLTETYGLAGVYIIPHPDLISPDGRDLRPQGNFALSFLVYTSNVGKVLSRARGPRYLKAMRAQNDQSDPVNLSAHDWIRKESPVKPATLEDQHDDLLRKDLVDAYIARLNRHPGRNIRAVIGATETPGEAALEYLVFESKPWVTYAQFTNTGTGNTADWQKRVGLIHNQITGHDDILSVDYLTAGFDDYNAVNLSYEAPWLWNRTSPTRIEAATGFSEFTATDVGLPDDEFTGQTVTVAAGLTRNLYQNDKFFVDLAAALKWKDIEVNNEFAQVSGNELFLKPSLSLDAERKTRLANTTGTLALETNLAGIAGTDSKDLQSLGRTNVDSRWITGKMNVRHSFYLEPLIFGDDFRDPSTPETSTLAHEIRLNARGQYVFGNHRLVPQEKFVTGGLYSVRGYPQSVTSGDTGMSGSVEYRLHLPNLLPVTPNPRPTLFGDSFRLRPSQLYGVPDWDLVFKVFSDFGRTINHENVPGVEDNETLWSIGAGVELQVMKNLRFQVDYGYALSGLRSGNADRGNNEIHFSLSLFY